jgi:hypothetical protein
MLYSVGAVNSYSSAPGLGSGSGGESVVIASASHLVGTGVAHRCARSGPPALRHTAGSCLSASPDSSTPASLSRCQSAPLVRRIGGRLSETR